MKLKPIGRKGANALNWILGLLVIGMLGIGSWAIFGEKSGSGVVDDDGNPIDTTSKDATLGTLTMNGYDAVNTGTNIGGTSKYAFYGNDGNLGKFSTGTYSITNVIDGTKIDLLAVNSTFHHNGRVIGAVFKLGIPVDIPMYKNATITETMQVDNNINFLTNGGGDYNITSTSGVPLTFTNKITGDADGSTQDIVCAIELTNGTQVATSNAVSLTLSGQASGSVLPQSTPNWYTPNVAGSKVYTYERPAITGGVVVSDTLQIRPTSSGKFSGGLIYKTCKTKEYFVDSGTSKIEYGIEDSKSGTVQSKATYSTSYKFAD